MDGAADCDLIRRCRLDIYDARPVCQLCRKPDEWDGRSRSIRMLRESVLTDRKAQLCVGKLAASCPEQVGLGPGWEVIKFHDKTFLMHTGMDPGVFTLGYFDPSARSGVIIFTNSSNGPHIILPVLKLLNADPDFIAFLAAQV